MSKYRCLRGMVFHVLPILRGYLPKVDYPYSKRGKGPRQLVTLIELNEQGSDKLPRGHCWWCRLPVCNRRRTYCDDECRKQRDAVLGYRVFPSPLYEAKCAVCGEKWNPRSYPMNLQVDHMLAIHKARRVGTEKALVAAFLISNLRWLCLQCHVTKTTADRQRPSRSTEKVEQGRIL